MDFLRDRSSKAIVAVAMVGGLLSMLAQAASADAVSDAFTSLGTSATTTIGLGVALIVTVLTLGFGVRFLVKLSKKASGAV